MKNVLIILGLWLPSLALAAEISQSTMHREPEFSIAPTLSLTNFEIKGAPGPGGARSGLGVGAIAQAALSREFDVEVGLGYVQAGGRDSDLFNEYEISLDYITLPVAAAWNIYRYGANEQHKLFLKAGATGALLTAAKIRASGLGFSLEEDIKDQTNAYDVMARAALGGTYAFGADSGLAYELSFLRGTQNVFKESGGANQGYMASISYTLHL